MKLSDILNRLGEDREHYFNAISPPIIQTSNFAFPTIADFRKAIVREQQTHVYTRGNNPTVDILRKKLAALEKTEDALVVGSGVTAVAIAVLNCVKAGDHIICVENPYSWTKALCSEYLPRFGVETTFVDGTDNSAIEAAYRNNTVLLILESPNSFTFGIQDLEWCSGWARSKNVTTIIDNSHASPLFQNPVQFGIDIVVHTITKYLNGHSDVVAGVICGSHDRIRRIFASEYMTLGTIISPHDAGLVLRGLRTLHLRMTRAQETALKMLMYFKDHPKVESVLYPLDPGFPQYAIARKQMSGCGGLMTIFVKSNKKEEVEIFVDRLERFELAVSWGGHESLVMPVVAFYGIEGKADPVLPWNCIRFYFGLEDPEDLIEDLDRAFEALV